MHALLLSFAVIFVAELGDKSQLMALTFAARYPPLPDPGRDHRSPPPSCTRRRSWSARWWPSSLPTDAINIAAGVAFLLFAAWTIRGDSLDDDDAGKAARSERSNRSAVLAASGAFFLAELGDKTMLATITLATTEGLFGTWLGSTLGMVAADALAILVGQPRGTPAARTCDRDRRGRDVRAVRRGVVVEGSASARSRPARVTTRRRQGASGPRDGVEHGQPGRPPSPGGARRARRPPRRSPTRARADRPAPRTR